MSYVSESDDHYIYNDWVRVERAAGEFFLELYGLRIENSQSWTWKLIRNNVYTQPEIVYIHEIYCIYAPKYTVYTPKNPPR